jgi:hypothetical protein
MKKIHWFHIIIITFLAGSFYLNNQGNECTVTVLNNLFLTMITIAYCIATLLTWNTK